MKFENNAYKVRIAGQFKGYGCENTYVGLIVRAYINGSSDCVKINGGGAKATYKNLGEYGGGKGTDVNLNLKITSCNSKPLCGPQDIKVEIIPFIDHQKGIVASDLKEDDLLTSADVRGWQNVTYLGRKNCNAANASCWGVLEKTVEGALCTPTPTPTPPPPACNTACVKDGDCTGAKDGCTACVGGVCKPPPACNIACVKDGDCTGAKDGCTACVGGVCKPPPACNVACTKDGDCAGAKDGCVACVGGVCKPPPSCGTACTTKAQCVGAKDGCSECLEGTCTNFNNNMCKCDGMVADLVYPSNNFNFEAFGKVEGDDVKKAQIADVTFRMTKDNQVVAKSDPITPTVVESSANKLRVSAKWSTPPPPISKGSTYRVFADVRCKPKRIVSSVNEIFSPAPKALTNNQSEQEKAQQPKLPPGIKLISEMLTNIASEGNDQFRAVVGSVNLRLTQVFAPSANAQSQLQLQTLNFVKVLDTDNCRFVMFKFDETLF